MESIELNAERFLGLLEKLIGETEHLQNNPPKFIPEEDRAGNHVLDALRPYTKENGGPLIVEKHTFVPGRGNLIITYPSAKPGAKTVAFVGSHLDVVPANPSTWKRHPFRLTVEGDYLYGRGTTDCLGHVALLTDFFIQLAERRPALNVTVAAVFIASEESVVIPGVGVEKLVEEHKMDFIKDGPVYWVDSSDSQPCIGTAGALVWHLGVQGKLFHSGLPHKAINALEFGMAALQQIQERFYHDFPPCEQETKWNFQVSSSMKPTQFKTAEGSLNQIPGGCTISGDIRLTPFYDVAKVKAAIHRYVDEINNNPTSLVGPGPSSKFALPAEGLQGRLDLTWENVNFVGIACNIDSPGYKAVFDATKDVLGETKPFAICGSLPLVKELQDEGFDIQIIGYGKSEVYHGDNEYCKLSDMKDATKILSGIVTRLNVWR